MTIFVIKDEYGNYYQSYHLIEGLGLFTTKIVLIQAHKIKNNKIETIYDLSTGI